MAGKVSHNDLPNIRLERAKSWLAGKPQGPVFLEIFPTAACNLDCLFCWRQVFKGQALPPELSDARLNKLADEAVELGVLEVCVKGGGEPLLRRAFIEHAAKAFARGGVLAQLITNGTLFDDNLCSLLVDMGWDDVALSVDAADPQIHDRLRAASGAFERTMRAAEDFRRIKRSARAALPLVSMHCVLTNTNYLQPGKMLELAARHEMSHVLFDSMGLGAPACEGLKMSEQQLDEFDSHIDEWEEQARKLAIHTNLSSFRKKGSAARQAPDCAQEKGKPFCHLLWHQLSVREDGGLLPCCTAANFNNPLKLGSMSLREAWFSAPLEALRRGMLEGKAPSFCRSCHDLFRRENSAVLEGLRAS